MGISFVYPEALWLVCILPIFWFLALFSPARHGAWRRWLSLVLRTLVVLALIGALTGAQLVQPPDTTTTIFLLDGSDSVAASQRARAEAFIAQALATMPPDDQAGIIVFGREALVERLPSPERTFGAPAARPFGGATNIAEALQLGLAMLPAEGHRRLVLLSDGGENRGSAREIARHIAVQGVPVDVVPLSGSADGLDAQVVGVSLPAAAREGQRLPLRVDLESTTPVAGRLTVTGPDGRVVATLPVEIGADRQTISILLPEAPVGFNRYTVRLEVPDDARTQNNAIETFSFVRGKPQVLLVAQSIDDVASLERALRTAQIDVTVADPASMPDTFGELSLYDAVALVNVPRALFSDQATQQIAAYVRDFGGGLLMVGGPQSFGPGGWRGTPVEAALPVTMDIPERQRQPPVSVVVVIDISGSMSSIEDGVPKLSLALEGARRIATLLRDEDELTVIPFDDRPGVIVGPLPGWQRDAAIEQLNQVRLGGSGINIHDALQVAARYARASKHPVRHIITITDGNDTTQQEGALEIVRDLHDEGVTLTSIAIGQGEHVPFIRDMAAVGGGRTFLTERAADVPDLLTGEAQTIIAPYIVEGALTPQRGMPHPILRGIDIAPDLHGYVLTTPRATAQVALLAPSGDTLLAAWQYGLGRSLAWTSDFSGRWAKEWVAWDTFPQFSAQLLTWLLPQQTGDTLTIATRPVGDALVIEAIARSLDGEPQTGLRVSSRLIAVDGAIVEAALREVSPGQYRTSLDSLPAGAYLVQIIARDGQGTPVALATGGAAMPFSAEYRSQAGDRRVLEEIAHITGGRIDPQPQQVFERGHTARGVVRDVGLSLLWVALVLWPMDIALRRIFIPHSLVAATLQRIGLRTSTVRHAPQETSETAVASSQPSFPAAAPRQPSAVRPRATRAADELERLRAAQEAARRRLRGEGEG
ncbi:MAG: VWA domain-containing protein [Roseiflexaceae bacterium]|nr:VWA domain-containing protein [Roseiflexaceae bacterium]